MQEMWKVFFRMCVLMTKNELERLESDIDDLNVKCVIKQSHFLFFYSVSSSVVDDVFSIDETGYTRESCRKLELQIHQSSRLCRISSKEIKDKVEHLISTSVNPTLNYGSGLRTLKDGWRERSSSSIWNKSHQTIHWIFPSLNVLT